MRALVPALLVLLSSAFGQSLAVASVPASPYELVTGPAKLLGESDQRASVLGLIERARQNSDLHAAGGHPYLLKVSFEASGDVAYTGAGQFEELWYAPGEWRWKAHLGSYTQDRINLRGRVFDQYVSPMPLRLQMVKGAIFWPILMRSGAALRISAGTWQGKSVLCVLGSRMLGNGSDIPGRRWQETEFCMDTNSGLLQTYSIAPGIYAVYDYQDTIRFHASILPRTISIYEANKPVLQIHLDSLSDAPAFDQKEFTPTPQMKAQPTSPMIAGTVRFPMAGGISPVETHGQIQPVIVHASVTGDGNAEEVEALQNSDPTLSAAAVALVRNARNFPSLDGNRSGQREIFVNVRFMPPPAAQSGK